MEKRTVINSQITTGSFDEFIENIFDLVGRKKSSYVCCANVHMLIEAYKDNAFNKVLNEADLVTPDGTPLSKVIKWFDKIDQERVAGMDLMPTLLEEAERRGKSVYFYGSTVEVLSKIRKKVSKNFPNLNIAGTFSPPFRPLIDSEDQEVVDDINMANPDILFVALGCPKQEKWMAAHKEKLNTCMIGVGQSFMVFAGVEKRLPLWARNLSLEWAYRLYQEPRRLWKRYLFTNSMFIFLILRNLFPKLYNPFLKKGPSKL
ncbi:WecB/TagA/CpsF family glycosyltransferase [Xanthovirga aplysinae]|uniref:WecB/TagA/CpsF family glycosyltransferase n=1 Tax=Xanthovirga aplysinae TaxID=2529853 RepID=UPI0012BCCB9B|nr:WecB/TagA/CpsF family glycosyltransferase [Xanthovirga aplysinae]MTI29792.1 glycosyltransferase [Xanthovirga aplysinae]